MTIHSKKLIYSENSDNCWFAWSNGNNTVYTQTDEPETICDWTFSEPNEIAHKIDEVNSNTITSNGITYTRNRELDNNQLITSFYFTINTEGYRSGNKEFIIPIDSTTYINPINVDWGDGTQELINDVQYPSHTYSQVGTYQIKISADSGCMPFIGYKGDAIANQYLSCDSAFLTSYRNGAFVKVWSSWEPFAFAKKLTYVPTSMLYQNRNITHFYEVLDYSGLKKIPKRFFKYQKKIQRLYFTFGSTPVEEIPDGIFDDMENLNDAAFCFNEIKIKHVPQKIFKYNKKIQRIEGLYSYCTELEDSPVEVLNSLLDGTDYNYYGQFSLGRLVAGTKGSETLTQEYLDKFIEMSGRITACCYGWNLRSIPTGIFDKYTEETNFTDCFESCNNLESVPENLFKYNTKANSFQMCFMMDRYLNLNSNIFCNEQSEKTTRFANYSPDFYYCFYYAGNSTSKTGIAPELWNYEYAYANTYKKSEHTVASVIQPYSSFVDDLGDTYTYKRYIGYDQTIWMSMYEWECNTDPTKKYYIGSDYVNINSDLYITELVKGGKVKKTSCFGSAGVANYADIPKSWGGIKEE